MSLDASVKFGDPSFVYNNIHKTTTMFTSSKCPEDLQFFKKRMVLHVETVSLVVTHKGSALRSLSISGVERSMKSLTTMASIGSLDAASIQEWKAELETK